METRIATADEMRVRKYGGYKGFVLPIFHALYYTDAQSFANYNIPIFRADRDYEMVEAWSYTKTNSRPGGTVAVDKYDPAGSLVGEAFSLAISSPALQWNRASVSNDKCRFLAAGDFVWLSDGVWITDLDTLAVSIILKAI